MCFTGLWCVLPAENWVSTGLEYFCKEEADNKSKSKELKNTLYKTNKLVHVCLCMFHKYHSVTASIIILYSDSKYNFQAGDSLWCSSIPPSKFWNSTLKYTMSICFWLIIQNHSTLCNLRSWLTICKWTRKMCLNVAQQSANILQNSNTLFCNISLSSLPKDRNSNWLFTSNLPITKMWPLVSAVIYPLLYNPNLNIKVTQNFKIGYQ